MADDEHTPEQPDEPEKLMLVYLRRIDTRLDGIERKLDEVVVRLAAGERDFAAMQVRLDNLDRRVARINRDTLQRELAKLAADIESYAICSEAKPASTAA
jgi:tetrahydromethanopterin S-methyltransferase subunit G